MKRSDLFFTLLSLIFISTPNQIFSQQDNADTITVFKTAGGEEYKASGLYQRLWGSNYRNVWTMPVIAKVLWLDTAQGGLKPFRTGSGIQIENLYLKNAVGEEYLLLPIDKNPGKILPEKFKNTFIEDRFNDAESMSNPYAAVTTSYLADNAQLYHHDPLFIYVPNQPALDEYNNAYGNTFYVFERIIDSNSQGNSSANLIETAQLIDTLKYNNSSRVNVKIYMRERLFDMFVNDWDRHDAQWLWSAQKSGNKKIYTPVPRGREQAYFKYNGMITGIGMKAVGLGYLQSFDDNFKNVNKFNLQGKNLDRRLLNEATLDEWKSVASDLQQSFTDEVIENAVKYLPEEVYPLIGNDIIKKLKARRCHLVEWATDYYNFLSKEVEIPGSYKSEEFNVQYLNNSETLIRVFNLNDQNKKNDTPYYSRIFKSAETKEIRLFGLSGNDKYVINGGNNNNAIKVKIIAGTDKDSVIDISSLNKKNKNVIVYGDEHHIKPGSQTQLNIVNDTIFHFYKYDWYRYDKNGLIPMVFYSLEDRLFVGLGYSRKHYTWDKKDFVSNQLLSFHYSLMENAPSITYRGLFPKLIAHSDLTLMANYDDVRWTYFFGLGNETKFSDNYKLKYYTMRTTQWIARPGLVRKLGKSTVNIFASLNGIKVINDTARFINKTFNQGKSVYDWQTFAGAGISYSFQSLNDPVVPTKGVFLNATVSGAKNLKTNSVYYFKYSGTAHFYVPLISKFSLNIRTGIETVTGNPEFYQYQSIGGIFLRGVVYNRFWGKTAFYNTNDLRFISNVRNHFFVGKAGLFVFTDDGRVWMPDEKSDIWHIAYGGGIIVAPFNFLYADLSYGRLKKEHTIQVRLTYFIPN